MLSGKQKSPFRFAISATFTAEPIEPVLCFWGEQLGAKVEVRFAPYNQISQTLLDPASEFSFNAHGVNIILARLEDLSAAGHLEANLHDLVQHIRAASTRLAPALIFCLCPSSPGFACASGLDSFLANSLSEVPGVQFLHFDEVRKLYPVERWYSQEGDQLGKIPFTEAYYTALGTALVRQAYALQAPPFKVIALDCDNTLWQGICGEDGPAGIVLDAPRRVLQEFMLEQREAGMLLAIVSKNNEEDVWETFRLHPDMPLQPRHFSGWRINWEAKAENLRSLAAELSLSPDSFIFVDDNPRECAEIEETLPQVLALALPPDVLEIPHFLDHVWAFDHLLVTEEDRNRSAYYAQAQEFGRELHKAVSLEDFVAGLQVRVAVNRMTPATLPRVAQLTQRTNQFNFSTIRRSEAEMQALSCSDTHECFTAVVSDRFGEYGLTGVLILEIAPGELRVDTLLLSCRVLGRGVEHRLMAFIGGMAHERGLDVVSLRFRTTAKNAPSRQFLDTLEAERRVAAEGEIEFRFQAGYLGQLEWKPAVAAQPPQPAQQKAAVSEHRHSELARIARTLSTPVQILDHMRASRSVAEPQHVPMTDTERQLASIWQDLLRKPAVLPGDNFFDLGGHSLLAVLLLLRIRETFQMELSVDDVYSGTVTLSELAQKIEAYQQSDVSAEEYAALVAEIELLSDDEVRALLAREDVA